MAKTKKQSSNNKGSSSSRTSSNKASSNKNKSRTVTKSWSDSKQKAVFISFFASLLILAIVFIDANGVWGFFRSLIFGLFGFPAYLLPFFMLFTIVMAAFGKDSRGYKIKVIEGFLVFVMIISFIHIVESKESLGYWAQIGDNYKDGKTGVGVLGALLGGIPLLITGFNKVAAGSITVILMIAFAMIFTGTSVLRLLQSLKGPAEKVSEFAGEKMEEMKENYASSVDTMKEKREEKAKRAENRRKNKVSTHEVDLDIPLDDGVFEDVGIEPIIGDPVQENVTADDIIELFNDNAPEEEPADNIYVSLSDKKLADVVEEVADEAILEIDSETGEVLEDTSEDIASEEIETTVSEEPKREYALPPIDYLDAPKRSSNAGSGNELREKGETIVKTLQSFGVGTRIVEICQSPSVTRFELQPDPGVKISKITALADDIAMNLAASGVRIEAPIPNKNAVGIEVPNAEKAMVTLREIIESDSFANSKSKLNVALGRDIQGEATCADLAKMPHLLVAGTTGSGKSVCLNTMIVSLLYNATPDEVKLIMIDPKKVEFTVYKSIPHLLVPVVADPRKAAGALAWAVGEMDKRYALFADNGVRNLQGYNTYAVSHGLPKMPQIVIIIDELSDLMMAASNEVEDSICRLAQKARAAGMHLIVATQRPSVDVITGLIKANIPSRIAFAVKSQIDSRTIIDTQGAEKLLGNGDMLYCPVGLSKPVRVQGSYVSDDEIERVIEFVTSQGDVKYDDSVMQEIEIKATQAGGKKKGAEVVVDTGSSNSDYEDEMIPKAIEVVVEAGMASTTLLQRKLKLGYARAARIVDELSEKGIIGPFEGSKPRKVLITKEQWYEMQANSSVSAPKQLSVDDIQVNREASVSEPETTISEDHNYFGGKVNDDFDEV